MYVKEKWSTETFRISRGVFQGDTSSPLIFLVALNPIIQMAYSLQTCGLRMRIPTGTPKPPDVNSYVYALREEPDSEEPQYLA